MNSLLSPHPLKHPLDILKMNSLLFRILSDSTFFSTRLPLEVWENILRVMTVKRKKYPSSSSTTTFLERH
jgi:hypothetical protein